MDKSKANVNYRAYRAFKLEETWNGNGMILHEVYWDTMGGDGKYDDRLGCDKKDKGGLRFGGGLEGGLPRGREIRKGMGGLFAGTCSRTARRGTSCTTSTTRAAWWARDARSRPTSSNTPITTSSGPRGPVTSRRW